MRMKKIAIAILIMTILAGGIAPVFAPDVAYAQAGVEDADKSNFIKRLDCGWATFLPGGSTPIGCAILGVLYALLVVLPTAILGLVALFFNHMAMFTLNGETYTALFIKSIWKVIRDFSNIFFILILLYAALQLILGIGHDTKKIVAWTIVIALLMNFSLFLTRVVVDASNITALVFYNSIDTSNVRDESVSGERMTASALVSNFKINNFFTDPTLDAITGATDKRLSFMQAIYTMFIYALVIFPLAYVFFVAGWYFLARTITLMLLMMASPFAFMSYAVPQMRSIDMIGFESWWHKLLSSAFSATIFMVIIYICSEILKAGPFSGINQGNGFFALMLAIFLPAAVIIILMLKGLSFAKKGSEEAASAVMGIAKTVGGIGLGVATGGTALMGRKFIGGAAARVAGNDKLKERAAAGDKGAQRTLDRANYLTNKSFDIRQTKLGKLAAKKSGIDLNAGASWVGLGDEVTKGGYKEQQKKKQDRLDEKMESYEIKGKAAREANDRNKQYEDDKKFVENRIGRELTEQEERNFKDLYARGKGDILKTQFGLHQGDAAQTAKSISEGDYRSARQINEDRREAFAASQEDPWEKRKDTASIRNFFANLATGPTTKTGAAAMVTGFALAGPIGAAVALPIYGLTAILKDLVAAKARSGGQKIPYVGNFFRPDEEMVHNIRTGDSRKERKDREKHHENEELKELMRKLAKERHGGRKKSDKDKADEEEEHEEGHP